MTVPRISVMIVSILKLKSKNNTGFMLLNQSYFNSHFDMAYFFFFLFLEIVWYRMCALMWTLKIMFQHGLFSTVYQHRCISRILCLLLSIIEEMLFHMR